MCCDAARCSFVVAAGTGTGDDRKGVHMSPARRLGVDAASLLLCTRSQIHLHPRRPVLSCLPPVSPCSALPKAALSAVVRGIRSKEVPRAQPSPQTLSADSAQKIPFSSRPKSRDPDRLLGRLLTQPLAPRTSHLAAPDSPLSQYSLLGVGNHSAALHCTALQIALFALSAAD